MSPQGELAIGSRTLTQFHGLMAHGSWLFTDRHCSIVEITAATIYVSVGL